MDSLARLLDHLELERAHLVGHSMGGMVVQEFMTSHGDRAHKLVLSATTPAFGKADGDFQKKFVATRIKPLDDGLTMADLARDMVPGMFGGLKNGKAEGDGLAIALDCMGSVPAATYRAAMECLVTFERRKALADIAVPTLVLAGEKDTNAPAAVMKKMAGFILVPQRA